MAQLLSGTRIYGTGTVDTQLIISGKTAASSTNTGALQVGGGVGIGGDLWLGGGNINILPLSTASSATNLILGDTNFTVTGTSSIILGRSLAGDAASIKTYVSTTSNLRIFNGMSGYHFDIASYATSGWGPTGTGDGTRIRIDGATGNVKILNNNNSTSTTTGALQVVGGVGIGGDLFVAGTIYGVGGQPINATSTGTTSTFFINNNTTSTSTTTGALQVLGGAGIRGSLNVGGVITATSFFIGGTSIGYGYTGSTGTQGYTGSTGTTGYWGSIGFAGSVGYTGSTSTGFTGSRGYWGSVGWTGSQGYWGSVGFAGSVGYTGSTSTGFTGSQGYWGSVGWTGSQGYWGSVGFTGSFGYTGSSSGLVQTAATTTNATFYPVFVSANNATATGMGLYTTSSHFINPMSGSMSIGGIFTITNTTLSTSTTTGALQIAGGVGIGKGLVIGGIFTSTNTTLSTSTNTGALQIAGGVGIGGGLFVAGTVTATTHVGNLTGNVTGNVSGTAGSITGVYGGSLTSLQVTTALTFTPYSNTNPSGYISAVPNAATQVLSLGVGTASSGVTGEIRATSNVTAYYTSDRKLKENIQNITGALGKVKVLNGVMFDWKQDYIDSRGGEDGYFVRKHDTGIIAQEMETVLPEIVGTREDGTKAVAYEKMAGLLVEAIKELDIKIENLKKLI